MRICGIHTRLKNLINNCSGLNYDKRIHHLMNTYNLPKEKAELLYDTKIEERVLNGEDLSIVVNEVALEKERKDSEFSALLRMFYTMNLNVREREQFRN